jgi:phosphoserine phosphatase RsbU/P
VKFIPRSIAFKLTVRTLSGILLILLIILGSYYHFTQRILLNNVEEKGEYLTGNAVISMQNTVLSVKQAVDSRLSLLNRGTYNKEIIRSLAREIVVRNPVVFGSTVAMNPNGIFGPFSPYTYRIEKDIGYLDLAEDSDYNYSNQSWFVEPVQTGKGVWSEPYFDEGGGNILMTTYSAPVWDDDSVLIAIVTGDMSLQWLRQHMADLNMYDSGFSYLLSESGQVVSHPDERYILKESIFSIAQKQQDPELFKAAENITAGIQGVAYVRSSKTKEDYIMYYRPIPDIGWTICLTIPEKEFLADLYTMNSRILLIILIGLLIMILIIRFLADRITRPIVHLAHTAEAVGQGNFDVSLPRKVTGSEMKELYTAVESMKNDLKRYVHDIKETTAEREKYESEINVAHDIQMSIVPRLFPPFPDRRDLDIFACINTAGAMGSDFYDFFFIDKDFLCIALGEVSGKGIPASLFMAVTRTLLRSVAQSQSKPDDILQRINSDLCEDNTTGMSVALLVGILNVKTGKILYSNAGHQPPAVLRKSGQVEWILNKHGDSTGVNPEIQYSADTFELRPSDQLILYGDGVVRALNPEDLPFGQDRLEACIKTYQGKNPKELTNIILNCVNQFTEGHEQSDDFALLCLSYLGPEEKTGDRS